MSGPNQHYIPKFLQKAFGIRPRRVSIWKFSLNEAPECRRIKRTGASDQFYSAQALDGRRTLDDAITEAEQQIAVMLSSIRSKSPGDPVEAEVAAKVVSHLASRTAHVRSTLGDGMARLLEGAEGLFAEPANVQSMLGLEDGAPNSLIREELAKQMASWPAIGRLGIPKDLLDRMGLLMLQEGYGDVAGQVGEWMADLVKVAHSRTDEMIRDGHRRALAEAEKSNGLEATLRTFEWKVESGPPRGAILPDCVVVAFDESGSAGNHLFVGTERMRALVMAVSPELLLSGRSRDLALPTTLGFNREAARLSRDFFLAPRNDAETVQLQGMIGEALGPALDESLEGAYDDLLPQRVEAPQGEPESRGEASGWKSTTELDYEVSLEGCGDESNSQAVEQLLRAFISAMAKALPLDRLDGITVSDNYPAALGAVNRGFENAPELETVSAEVGIGIAQTVTVLRSGVVKGRIVLSNAVCAWLIADDRMVADWGVQSLVRQLARVALIQMVDEALPGHLLAPVKGELTGWLYQFADGVPCVYVASWTAAAFGDVTESVLGERELLAGSLVRLRSKASEAWRAFGGEVDVGEFLHAVMPEIGNVLKFAASLAGHCASTGVSAIDGPSALAEALDKAALRRWFDVYQADLDQFRRRLGKWESFEEFLAFNRHVERLLWGVGMILWEEGDAFRYQMVDGSTLFGGGGNLIR